jgi:hypothetical protein
MEDNIKAVMGGQNNNLEICCICYNNSLTLFLNCNHIICLECITNIKKLCCPLCREELSYLPKKIVNIVNGNSNSNDNTTNNYLSLIHNVVPLSLSSPNNFRQTINQNLNLTPITLLNPNLSSLSSTLSNSRVNNNLLYEQYFNDLAFIDIDDILHYGFISSMNENNTEAIDTYIGNGDDIYGDDDGSSRSGGSRSGGSSRSGSSSDGGSDSN